MDEVFRALADLGRRRLLDSLNARSGQTLRELCADMDMARRSVSKHLAVLEAAGLVSTVCGGGRSCTNSIRRRSARSPSAGSTSTTAAGFVPWPTSNEPWRNIPWRSPRSSTAPTSARHLSLWQALTDPAFTERYWGLAFETDWKPGSPLTLRQWGLTIADPEQVVLESEPYRRLSYTWHTTTPEWRAMAREKVGFDEEFLDRIAAEPRSKATFEIDDLGELVKLTVIHDGFEAGSEVLPTISQGWPYIISNLKTLLETGDVLPPPAPASEVAAPASS
jgi:uncharacterized protein YndB with AHSA1/START domain